jgi:hypothetical protein
VNADRLRPGMELTNAAHGGRPHTAVVSRVRRTRWRRHVTRFWLIWEDEDGNEAGHPPEDAAYLDPYDNAG